MAAEAHFATVNPAQLAALAPGLAPLRALDAPVGLSATAMLDADLVPAEVRLEARLGAGRLLIGEGSLPVESALLHAEGSAAGGTLHIDRLEVAPAPGGPRTVLHGEVTAHRAAGRIEADISGGLDQVDFADLPAIWPVGLGGPGLRPWIIENITAGVARNGTFRST